MSIHELVIGIHFIGVMMCIYSIYIIGKSENKEKANFMVVTTICNTVVLVGYILELMSEDLSAILVSVKVQYLGKAFIGTFLLFAFVRYYKWSFPKWLMNIFWFVDVAMFLFIFACEKHMMYYTSIDVKYIGNQVFFDATKSPVYVLFMIYTLGTLLLFAYMCYKHWKLASGRQKQILGKLVFTSAMADGVMILSIFNFAEPYDLVPMVLTTFTVVITVFIQRYGLFSTLDVAKDNLITNIDEGVIVRDVEGTFQYANPKAYDMIPQLNTDNKEGIDRVIDEVLGSRKSDIVIYDEKYYKLKVRDMYDNKEYAGEMLTFFDVTELQENNKRMEKLKIEADNANHAKSNFLANMSHEIRTPINAVLGMDEMILRECDDENIREYAINIKRAGETLLALVSDILDFSKIESGKMTIINEKYDTENLISDIVNTFSLRMREKGLSFMTEVDRNIPKALIGDEVRVKQVAMNILSNAYKYTKEGYVKFKISGKTMGDEYMLTVSVEDTGIGIKEEHLGKLFETFERIEEKQNRHIEGSGLGLNITSNILKMMGSEIHVKSVYGRGSIFSFDVEQKIADATPIGDITAGMVKEERIKNEEVRFTAPEGRILVVDDNVVNLTVMRGLLKRTKAVVDIASSGAECLRYVRNNKYHVIFMDHLMPNMDGIETLHRMKEMKENLNRDVPVIALTANAVSGARETYLSEGFDDYMKKPVDPRQIDNNLIKYMPEELIIYE